VVPRSDAAKRWIVVDLPDGTPSGAVLGSSQRSVAT
jgi:hypothetical protein